MKFSPTTSPYIKLFIPFVAGILASYFLGLTPIIITVGVAIALLVISAIVIPSYKTQLFSVVLNLSLLLLGGVLATLHNESTSHKYFAKHINAKASYLVNVTALPKQGKRTIRFVGEVLEVKNEGAVVSTKGKAMFYVKHHGDDSKLKYGDNLLVKATFAAFDEPAAGDDFNYKAYMALKHVHFRTYLRNDDWQLQEASQSFSLFGFLSQFRDQLIAQFEKHGFGGRDLGVVSALILGDKQYLDKDIKKAFAETGSLHVLAVSGLHVGIIYMILNYVLQLSSTNRLLLDSFGLIKLRTSFD